MSVRPVDGATALYAVLGRPIAHSLSPALHNAAFAAEGRNALYVACDVGEDGLVAALAGLQALGARGVNLTAPLKARGAAWVAERTPQAAYAGAVNTVRFADRHATGHNTDGLGCVAFLERAGVDVRGMRVAIVGAGGAALGLVGPLAAAGAERITCLVRDPSRALPDAPAAHEVARVALGTPAARAALAEAGLVVQATPLGKRPDEPMPCPPEAIDRQAVALDLGYHPAVTPWLAALRARGVRAANGLGLLIEQARLSQEFWHGSLPPRSALEEAVGWTEPFPRAALPGGGSPAA